MKYVSFSIGDYRSVGVLSLGTVVDVGVLAPADGNRTRSLRRYLESGRGRQPLGVDELLGLPGFDSAAISLEAVVPDPSKVLGTSADRRESIGGSSPAGSDDALPVTRTEILPYGHEARLPLADNVCEAVGRLAVVIARPAHCVSEVDASTHIAGFTCLLDISVSEPDGRSEGTPVDTVVSIGPYLVTPDEFGDSADVHLSIEFDAAVHARVAGFDMDTAARAVAEASKVAPLAVGDIVAFGPSARGGRIDSAGIVGVRADVIGKMFVTVVERPRGGRLDE